MKMILSLATLFLTLFTLACSPIQKNGNNCRVLPSGIVCATATPIPIQGSTTPFTGPTPPIATDTPLPGESSTPVAINTPTPAPTFTPTPPLKPELGIDLSNFWLPEAPSDEDAVGHMQRFLGLGFTHLVAGTQNFAIARQQLEAAQSIGMSVDIYVELSTSSNLDEEMADAVRVIDGLPVGATWIAFEVPPPAGVSADDWVQAGLDAAVRAGLPNIGIYTAAWWWDFWINDSDRFAGWPLWYAFYDGISSVNWQNQQFGSWVMPTWKQYLGSVPRMIALYQETYKAPPVNIPLVPNELGPVNVDLNVRP